MESKIIPVFSNKGGVGKTFVSVNLATAFALAGRRALLLDLDFQAGHDMARMLNLTPDQSLVELLSSIQADANPEIIKKFVISHSSGLDFLPAVRQAQQISHMTSEKVKLFFKKASTVYDYVIVDVGQSFSDTMLTVLDHSNIILLVATPDVLAVYQLRWCLELLQDMHFPLKMIKLILNRSESRGGRCLAGSASCVID